VPQYAIFALSHESRRGPRRAEINRPQLIAGNGPQNRYFVNEHADGDRDLGTFEGMIVTASGEVTIEGVWKYTGGTGNFEGLTGGGTYKGRMTSPTAVENTWEGTYELAAKARAA
jgi:hypothetical protein